MEGDFRLMTCSRTLFSYNTVSGKLNWKYQQGIIINPAIVQGDGKIFFIEIRDKELMKKPDGRFGLKDLLEKGRAVIVALDLKTGKKITDIKGWSLGGGCGTISCSFDSLFFRGGNPTRRDISSGKNDKLTMVTRPGCWINIIPAGGMVLIPEASSGCTCGYALQ